MSFDRIHLLLVEHSSSKAGRILPSYLYLHQNEVKVLFFAFFSSLYANDLSDECTSQLILENSLADYYFYNKKIF